MKIVTYIDPSGEHQPISRIKLERGFVPIFFSGATVAATEQRAQNHFDSSMEKLRAGKQKNGPKTIDTLIESQIGKLHPHEEMPAAGAAPSLDNDDVPVGPAIHSPLPDDDLADLLG